MWPRGISVASSFVYRSVARINACSQVSIPILYFRVRVWFSLQIEAEMAMKQFFSEIKGLKVKELPGHVKPMLSIDYIKKAVERGLDNYNAKYIQTGSIDPLLHVCFGGMVFSYLVALPEERRHLAHQQHAKEHGGHWSSSLSFEVRVQRWSICLSLHWIEPLGLYSQVVLYVWLFLDWSTRVQFVYLLKWGFVF